MTVDAAAVLEDVTPPPHPVRLVQDTDALKRSRALVLFRIPLVIPHLIWLYLWGYILYPLIVIQWLTLLIGGQSIGPFHRFIARYVRQYLHVLAFATVAGNPFPGFTGRPGHYPLDLHLPPASPQSRLKVAFRLLLVLPAIVLQYALFGVLFVCAVFTWVVALFLGRAPSGLHALMAYCLRYNAQINAYLLLLTDAYPDASPFEGAAPVEPPADLPPPAAPLAEASA